MSDKHYFIHVDRKAVVKKHVYDMFLTRGLLDDGSITLRLPRLVGELEHHGLVKYTRSNEAEHELPPAVSYEVVPTGSLTWAEVIMLLKRARQIVKAV